jgi:hypothetical protein
MILTDDQRRRLEAALRSADLPAGLRDRLRRWLQPALSSDGRFILGNRHDLLRQLNSDLAQANSSRGAAEKERQGAALDEQGKQLVSRGGSGVESADEILDNGRQGLRHFADFLPSYARCAGLPGFDTVAVPALPTMIARYDAERGLSLRAYRADADRIGTCDQALDAITGTLDDCGLQLAGAWTGIAAGNALSYYRQFAELSRALRSRVGDCRRALDAAMAAVESAIYDKARSVRSLYRPSIDGKDYSMVASIVDVAWGSADGWKQMLEWFGRTGHGSAGRQFAEELARNWLLTVFAPDVEQAIRAFLTACEACETRVRAAFAELDEVLSAVPADPYLEIGTRITDRAGLLGGRSVDAGLPRKQDSGSAALPARSGPVVGRRLGPLHGGGEGHMSAALIHDGSLAAAGGYESAGSLTRPASFDGSSRDAAEPAWARQPPIETDQPIGAGAASGSPSHAVSAISGVGPQQLAVQSARHPLALVARAEPSSTGGNSVPPLAAGHSAAGVDEGSGAAADPTATHTSETAHIGYPAMGLPIGALARGGANREVARRYPVRDDLVGEPDLLEWERLGPVIGEVS